VPRTPKTPNLPHLIEMIQGIVLMNGGRGILKHVQHVFEYHIPD
jgi:hypothetical protein